MSVGLQTPASGLSVGADRSHGWTKRPLDDRRAAPAPAGTTDLLGPNVAGRHTVILANETSVLHSHATWFDDATDGCTTLARPENVGTLLGKNRVGDAILIVDLAVFPRLAKAVEWLHAFRYDHPDVVVVAGFEQFPWHDMTCERFLMADASVKLPVTRTALALAVSAAMTNHAFTLPLRRYPMS
jgi:hypothetical protein